MQERFHNVIIKGKDMMYSFSNLMLITERGICVFNFDYYSCGLVSLNSKLNL